MDWLRTSSRAQTVGVVLVLALLVGVSHLLVSRHDTITGRVFRTDRLCTLGYFRRLVGRDRYFPSYGEWRSENGTDFYRWSACAFTEPRVSRDTLRQCVVRGNVSSLVVLGDSNGRKMFDSIRRLFTNGRCHVIAEEVSRDRVPDRKYLSLGGANWSDHLSLTYRHCKGCSGIRLACTYRQDDQESRSVSLEYAAMTNVVDDAIKLLVTDQNHGPHVTGDFWAPTTQEFLFRYFLADRYPDFLVLFLPFSHSKQMSVEKVAVDLSYLLGLVKLYIPQTTRVLLVPGFAEFESARRDDLKWYGRLFHGLTASDKIGALNRALYARLEPDLLDSHSHIHSFLDVFEASLGRDNWSTDGVHMAPVWYDSMTSLLVELMCNSAIHGDF